MLSRPVWFLVVAVLAALNAYLDVLHVRATRRTAVTRLPPLKHYSFIDEDYPPRMPLPAARRAVKLTLEDSARYALSGATAFDEWLWTATIGDGNAHLGANHRFFVLGVTHQLHCMRSYREALAQDGLPHGHQVGHLGHCLNFLRMSTLCAADVALEPPDALARNHEVERAGGERECMDWPAFYEEMKANYLEWNEMKQGSAS
ncbi:hypothetical protein C8Q78DRAFT_1081611 [Trametes maxima]|nr:hypothetical protein C8Q78DRAFT_1081611 [Trametes maxima]